MLYRANFITFASQIIDCTAHIVIVHPIHRFFGSQSRLVNIGVRRSGCYSAQANMVNKKSIGCAKYRTNIIQAAHIIENHHQRYFLHRLKLLTAYALQFNHRFLFHIIKKVDKTVFSANLHHFSTYIHKLLITMWNTCNK